MGYKKYLTDTLKPLRLYNLEEGYGMWELQAEGQVFDEIAGLLDGALNAQWPETADSEALSNLESGLFFRPAAPDAEKEKAAVAALMTLPTAAISLDELNALLPACGIKAVAAEGETPESLTISFPDCEGTPENFSEIKKRLELLLPAHLDISYGD